MKILLVILSEEHYSVQPGKSFEKKNVNKKVLTFNKAILSIFSNFILHKLIVSDNKDPPWLNTKTKSLIHKKIKT